MYCHNFKMYLSKLKNVFATISKCICPNWKMYFSKFENVFVQSAKCISHNLKMYLSKVQNIFVTISKCICPKCKMYLSQFKNVFVMYFFNWRFQTGIEYWWRGTLIREQMSNVFLHISKSLCANSKKKIVQARKKFFCTLQTGGENRWGLNVRMILRHISSTFLPEYTYLYSTYLYHLYVV